MLFLLLNYLKTTFFKKKIYNFGGAYFRIRINFGGAYFRRCLFSEQYGKLNDY